MVADFDLCTLPDQTMAHAPEHLLNPSLQPGHRQARLYSPRAMFYTAFFGGPIAAIAFSSLNSKQLGRVDRDMRWYVLTAIGTIVWMVGAIYLVQYTEMIPPDMLGDGPRTTRYLIRGFGLLVWGGFYYMHRPIHRANDLVGAEPLSPWKAAIGCIIAGAIVQAIIGFAIISTLGWA